MIRFKDSEPTKGKAGGPKPDDKVADKAARAEPAPEGAPKAAASKRKKNFGG
jgi:hypothetical protein